MKHIFILILSITCHQFSLSQQYVQGNVNDSKGNPIPFASITDTLSQGVICDSSGNFEFCFSSEKIIIQALGYQPDTITLKEEDNKLTIQLQTDKINLDEVAVFKQQSIENRSSVSTIVTKKKEIESLNPQNVTEILQTKTGFTNRSGYQAPIVLRGLSGKYLLVLRNGMRRFSSYPSGFMTHTINIYDLERIEVEKGAASVIYGSGAMGGIINLIDKSPFKQKGINAKLTTGYGTINNEKNILACGGWSNGKLALKTSFRYRTADDSKYPNGEVAENSFYTDKDFFVSAGYKVSNNQQVILSADIHDGGPWGKPVGFNGSDYMHVWTDEEKSNNINLRYKYNSCGKLKNLESNIFYSNESRIFIKEFYTVAGYQLSYVETTRFSDYYYGGNLRSTIWLNSKQQLITGAELYSFHISTPVDAIDYIEGIDFENRVSHNARSYVSGIYTEYTNNLTPKTKVIAGLRFDYASISEGDVYSSEQDEERNEEKHALSGNISLSKKFWKNLKLKANIAHSFRMPETTELYADSYTSNGIIYSNPDLEPEYCNSLDLCLNYIPKNFELEFSPFIWLRENMITKIETYGMPGTNYQLTNIEKARLWGGELTGKYTWNNIIKSKNRIEIQAGMAYTNGEDVSGSYTYFTSGTPLDFTPPFNLKSNICYYSPKDKKVIYKIALRTSYYTEQNRVPDGGYATPAYCLLGSTIGADFTMIKTKPTINFAINNLLNTEYQCYYSYLPSPGRDFRIFLSLHFN